MTDIADYAMRLHYALLDTDPAKIETAINILTAAFEDEYTIYTCGNGGSAAISNHLVCDCVKGVACDTDYHPRIVSLNSNDSLITAIANDIGYEYIFSKQIDWSSMIDEVLLVISSSGNSPNIVNALKSARMQGLKTIAIVGFDGGQCKRLADCCIHIPSDNYGIVEDASQAIMHYMAQSIRIRNSKNPEKLKL